MGSLYADNSLITLQNFPTSESVIEAGVEENTQFIYMYRKARSLEWAHQKEDDLIAAAKRNHSYHLFITVFLSG